MSFIRFDGDGASLGIADVDAAPQPANPAAMPKHADGHADDPNDSDAPSAAATNNADIPNNSGGQRKKGRSATRRSRRVQHARNASKHQATAASSGPHPSSSSDNNSADGHGGSAGSSSGGGSTAISSVPLRQPDHGAPRSSGHPMRRQRPKLVSRLQETAAGLNPGKLASFLLENNVRGLELCVLFVEDDGSSKLHYGKIVDRVWANGNAKYEVLFEDSERVSYGPIDIWQSVSNFHSMTGEVKAPRQRGAARAHRGKSGTRKPASPQKFNPGAQTRPRKRPTPYGPFPSEWHSDSSTASSASATASTSASTSSSDSSATSRRRPNGLHKCASGCGATKGQLGGVCEAGRTAACVPLPDNAIALGSAPTLSMASKVHVFSGKYLTIKQG